MDWRKHFIEAATLVGAAVVCAVIANSLAGRERKMQYVGNYPRATTVPVETTTVAAAPAPVQAAPAPAQPSTATIAPVTTATVAPPITPTKTTTTAPVKTATAAAPVVVQTEQFPPHPDKAYVEIGFDSVKKLHDKGALFLDARRTSVFEQGHIPGARSFSVWESDIDDKVKALFAERGDPLQQAEPIVVYCSGGDCEDSHNLAEKLWGIQYNNVYVYKDGFPDWQKRGGAVHTGGAP